MSQGLFVLACANKTLNVPTQDWLHLWDPVQGENDRPLLTNYEEFQKGTVEHCQQVPSGWELANVMLALHPLGQTALGDGGSVLFSIHCP